MNTRTLALLAVLSALPASAIAQQAPTSTQPATATADPYRDEPFVFERYDTTTTMKADGTGDVVQHVVVRVQSEGVARQFSVLNLSYASAYSTGTIDYVRVHKPDGATINTSVDDAMEMPAEVTREAPMYSDLKEKHLPVRGLASGDRLEYQFHTTITKAQAPGQFWGADHFLVQVGVVLEQSTTLAVPEKSYVQVWSPNHKVTPVTKDGMKVWTWTSSQTKASARDENGKMTAADVKDPDEDTDGRKLPSVAWTTFHSWAEVGDWYRSLAEQRLQPTATVRAKAEELTKNAKTPEEQAQALYRFVATQIRYISLSFGVGRFQPHTPDEVLDHGYGDCKDKDTLLESLLRAKGMTTAPVLIGAGIAPVQDVPSPAVFNHAITTVELPGADGKPQRIWLDSTAEFAPFRVLMPQIRDQEALVIPDKAPAALEKTPANPPYAYEEDFTAEGTLDKDGLLKSHMVWTARSDNELDLRAIEQRVSPAQWDEAMQYLSNSLGFGGKVSHADLRPGDPHRPVTLEYDYSKEDFGDWKENRIVPLFPYLAITTISKDKAPEYPIDLGAPRVLKATTLITLPKGEGVQFPDPVHVKRDYATFDQTYDVKDGKITIKRTTAILKQKVPKEQWKDYLDFTKAVGMNDGPSWIIVFEPTTPTLATSPSSPVDQFVAATAQAAMTEASAREKLSNWTGARRVLQDAADRFPDAAYVHSMLGFVNAHDGKYDDAIALYKDEIAKHPDVRSPILIDLAIAFNHEKRYSEAAAMLSQFSGRNDARVQTELAYEQILMKDDVSGLATTRSIVAAHPENYQMRTQVARILQRTHRDDEATIAVKEALDGNTDANLINDNAYFLAEMNREIPLAEITSRRSVQMEEEKAADVVLANANANAFTTSAHLVSAWDTLGYVLYLGRKPKEAEPYLKAAWFQGPDLDIGYHLGLVYEALGKKDEALAIDRKVASMWSTRTDQPHYADVKLNLERLEKDSPREKGPLDLTVTRIYSLKRPADASGYAIVRLQFDSKGVHSAMLVNGDDSLKPLLDSLSTILPHDAVPPTSPALIVRDGALTCDRGNPECTFIFMPGFNIAAEGKPR